MGDQDNVSKMIKDLKEIVNCYDSEIYSMLVECNMDPYETVIRLLCQGFFSYLFFSSNFHSFVGQFS